MANTASQPRTRYDAKLTVSGINELTNPRAIQRLKKYVQKYTRKGNNWNN